MSAYDPKTRTFERGMIRMDEVDFHRSIEPPSPDFAKRINDLMSKAIMEGTLSRHYGVLVVGQDVWNWMIELQAFDHAIFGYEKDGTCHDGIARPFFYNSLRVIIAENVEPEFMAIGSCSKE